MDISLSPAAAAFIQASGQEAVTICAVLISSCCGAPQPPAVQPGPPADAEGFHRLQSGGIVVYYDSLLDEPPKISINVKDFGSYRELYVEGWE